jgi:hypothetical protein
LTFKKSIGTKRQQKTRLKAKRVKDYRYTIISPELSCARDDDDVIVSFSWGKCRAII